MCLSTPLLAGILPVAFERAIGRRSGSQFAGWRLGSVHRGTGGGGKCRSVSTPLAVVNARCVDVLYLYG